MFYVQHFELPCCWNVPYKHTFLAYCNSLTYTTFVISNALKSHFNYPNATETFHTFWISVPTIDHFADYLPENANLIYKNENAFFSQCLIIGVILLLLLFSLSLLLLLLLLLLTSLFIQISNNLSGKCSEEAFKHFW